MSPLSPAKPVFVTCPFDPDYALYFDAIVFAIVYCGYSPRSALETGTVAEPRMARITRALFESQYSIHDLSRCHGEGDENLARFNMPLELGMAIAKRFMDPMEQHDWMVLIPPGHSSIRYVSDLAGYDLEPHDDSIDGVIAQVVSWLASRALRAGEVTPVQVMLGLTADVRAKKELQKEWGGRAPWAKIVETARATADEQSRGW